MISKLSQRELQVLDLLVIGCSNSQISARLYISLSTVKAHVQAILTKLNVKNRVQAATIAANFLGITHKDIAESIGRRSR